MTRLYSAKEAADRLDVSKQRVDQLIREGQLPSTYVAGRRVIYAEDLDALEERRRARGIGPRDEAEASVC